MKNFFEGLKDFIYDSIDYIIMLSIIIGVVFVIGWRLDVLFAKDNTELPPSIVVDNNLDKEDDEPTPDTDLGLGDNEEILDEDIVDDGKTNSPDEVVGGETNQPPKTPETTVTTPPNKNTANITIKIPEGTLPSGIGSILESSGLVTSKNDFVLKAQSMNMDRKLKSGTYEIPSDSTLEDIVKIIAKQK